MNVYNRQMSRLVKNIALTAGTGIALGIYMTSSTRSPRKPEGSGGPDALILEPLLDRLEQLETRFFQAGANGAETAEVQSLKQSMAAQEAEVQALRAKVVETERRAAALAEANGVLQRAMADQLTSIGGLRDRAVESDANLQRLIAVVERLCDRPPQPSSTLLPFEAQLAEAVQRDAPVETRVRVIKENDPERRHRLPLGRTFAFFLAALLPAFYRS